MKITQNLNPDRKAVAVATQAANTDDLNAVILFGARARGNHGDQSDIDIMVVTNHHRTPRQESDLIYRAYDAASNNYETPPHLQIMWVTQETYNRWSRTINHPIANALAEAFHITGDPVTYGPTDGQLEHLYTQELTEQAEETAQRATNGLSIHDPDTRADVVGQNAKATLELTMRAALSAHQRQYSPKATLAELAQMVNQYVPEANFRPQSDLQALQTNVSEKTPGAKTQKIYDLMLADANYLCSLTIPAHKKQLRKTRRRV